MLPLLTLCTRGVLIAVYRLLGLSVRIIDDPIDQLRAHRRNANNILFGIWHEFSVVGIYWYRHRRGSALVEDSWKGDVLAGIMNHFGFKDFRINSNNSRAYGRGVLGFIRYLKDGHDGTIAMDGPNGPARQAKPGILHIAAKSGALIIPGGAYFSHAIRFKKRWDNYQIPLPFSRCHMVFGEPFEVPPDFREREQEVLDELNRITDELTEEARQRGRAYSRSSALISVKSERLERATA
ncbi:lysophospholipid acyltransferase family protein [Spirochaeta africana]|uniref:DUF374 domain-containing protein n=1 Tax=Spirochaeta africana (strain ATCC 700263 / DSM 8902 / Z-7692) TaxID=889378 RepID=H9ULS0_SPIAZ|nr:DUF374 domain-containing protein [Spirochaeta africana]AFG38463.1 hypothetical protein Spiaf_2432 [Spirochaeta africana DSM 8902]